MLATFVIGLREGLEAALIVGIIAAFLRKNGRPLTAMWIGVGLAVILSIAVGVGLDLVEQALPQAEQEAMETVIGAVAVFFVTGMIVWMNKHARELKRELEAQAAEALGHTGSLALAVMAFLAVLREGFETSVFLLATFSAAQSAVLAAAGAILGILLAIVIGWGIYAGGVRINLGRFFRITGAFLILVAAGLVLNALRTAHEAGWLNAGQQATVNLGWIVAPGTVRSALITGVLGIPADPRLIEVIGWFAYLVPVSLFIYWPAASRPSPRGVVRLQTAAGAVLALLAAGLAIGMPAPRLDLPERAPIVGADGAVAGTVRLGADAASLELERKDTAAASMRFGSPAQSEDHDGIMAQVSRVEGSATPDHAPARLTLDQLLPLVGGRIPVGLSPHLYPGPYDAAWRTDRTLQVWTVHGVLLDASEQVRSIVSLSGGGLRFPRVVSISGGDPALSGGWTVSPEYRNRAAAALAGLEARRAEYRLWAEQLPLALLLAAIVTWGFAARNRVRLRRSVSLGGSQAAASSRGSAVPHAHLTRQFLILAGLGAGLGAAAFAPNPAWAQSRPPAPVKNGVSQVAITLTGENGGACALDHDTAKAGPITFTVTNKTATGITEVELQSNNRIIGEKENLAPGLPSVAMTLTLGGGTYQVYCPGAKKEMLAFTVTGKAAPQASGSVADLLNQGAKEYANYVNGVADAMVTAVANLKTAIDAGDLAKAKEAYPLARPFYERIESDVDGFVIPGFKATDNAGNLDYLIDMRASNLDPKVGWHGFHAIERDLFGKGQITDETKQLAAELAMNTGRLDKVVKGLSYKPEDLANGAADLLEEVQRSKISGEEESYSHIDLVDFAANVEGAEQAFAFLEPGLGKIDPDLTKQVRDQFTKVHALLETYRDPGIPGGYKIYTAQVKAEDAVKLSKTIQALQEPLSRIAEKVATAGTAE
ncbi:MAG TPA: iron uptake system protein EfeO [Rhodopila sp.]|uniref:iron uptake system protein EfeO n=1 Tax=Rhodopila sp. TaxID=2480087 RepID=UPI002BC8E17C|nr:iron uptake system protein EfeO [Rhodopila sp.]HVY14378.1 iron uptake system protein EfeO [Rhodopila sp.]